MANSDSSGVIYFFLIFAMLGPRCSSVVAAWALQFQHELSCPEACGILVPQPGTEPEPLALEVKVLTMRHQRNSGEFPLIIISIIKKSHILGGLFSLS